MEMLKCVNRSGRNRIKIFQFLCLPPLGISKDNQFSWASISGVSFKKQSINLEANTYMYANM